MRDTVEAPRGDRNKLTYDQHNLLIDKVLPTARSWVLNEPRLREHGLKTLAYWGEPDPRDGQQMGKSA